MIYLQQFLRALNVEERDRLAELELTQTQRAFLEAALRHLDSVGFKTDLMTILDMSSSHFDKTASLLLQQCYTLFAQDNDSALYVFLNRKNLDALTHHELNKREKQLVTLGDSSRLQAFYLSAFMMFRATNFDRYNPHITEAYAKKYLQTAETKNPCEHARIRLLHLFVLLHYLRAVKPLQFDPQSFHEQLAECELLLHDECPDSVRFELCKTRATLLRFEGRLDEGIQQLDLAMENYDRQPQQFRVFDRVSLLCQKAEMLRDRNRFQECYELYTSLFREHEDLLFSMFHHINRYAESALLQERYTEALSILDRYLKKFVGSDHVSVSTNACLSYAKAHLFLGHWKEVHHYIALGQHSSDKTLFLHADIEFRNLQTACFYLQGDFDTCEMVANRNIKFLQQKTRSAEMMLFTSFYRMTLGFINYRLHHKAPGPKLASYFDAFQSGVYGVYGKILQRMRADIPL